MIYAPIDLAAAIAAGLAKRGHKIDFYAPLGSHVRGVRMKHLNLRALATNQQEFRALLDDSEKMSHYMPSLWDGYMANKMFAKAADGGYDLLHFHHPEVALPAARAAQKVAVVHTMHDPIYPWYKELFELYHSPNQHFISISNNQRRDAPDLPYAGTAYNGVDVDQFKFLGEPEDYLFCAGRIVPEKGIKEAIQVAKQTGSRLLIAGPVYPRHQGYFDQYIKPHLNEKILYLGYIEQAQLVRYYQKAKALLTPVQWEEPFGLTTIEAMACGTPVISLRRGAAPEIIEDGKTGYIVDSLAEMAQAVKKAGNIDRRACRDHVKRRFSHQNMIDAYERIFENILREQRRKHMGNYVTKKIRRTFKKATRGIGRKQ
jgi:glycosyltransferase involved in cell wall biosynthesis